MSVSWGLEFPRLQAKASAADVRFCFAGTIATNDLAWKAVPGCAVKLLFSTSFSTSEVEKRLKLVALQGLCDRF